MSQKKKVLLIVVVSLITVIFVFSVLILTKKISVNKLAAANYQIKGIDVSNYQGDIDWEKIESQKIDFAYIKATEGSGHVDKCFNDNWNNIEKTNVYAGAYHFFSFESAGKTQADNYINTVGSLEGKMVPAVDVEYYGNIKKEQLDIESIKTELRILLEELEKEYNKRPVIYCTYKAYDDFIKGSFDDYDLWMRNVYVTPDVTLRGKWSYWQYTDKAILSGYNGAEKYIDMNVFKGDLEQFKNYNGL